LPEVTAGGEAGRVSASPASIPTSFSVSGGSSVIRGGPKKERRRSSVRGIAAASLYKEEDMVKAFVF